MRGARARGPAHAVADAGASNVQVLPTFPECEPRRPRVPRVRAHVGRRVRPYCNHSRHGPAAAACPPLGGFCTSQAFSLSVVSPPPSPPAPPPPPPAPPPPWRDRTQYLVGASPVATARQVALPPLRSSQYGRVAYTLSFAFKYAGACGGANASSSSQAVLWRGCDGSRTAFRAPSVLVGPDGRVSASHSACALVGSLSSSNRSSSPGVALSTDQCVSHAADIVAHAALAG